MAPSRSEPGGPSRAPVNDESRLDDEPSPGPSMRDQSDLPGNKFAFSPNQLHTLVQDRKVASLDAIGGLPGLCAGLRTDPKAGVSADETELDGVVTLGEALEAARCGRPAVATPSAPSRHPTTRSRLTVPGQFSVSSPAPFSDRRRVFGENRLPRRKQKSFWSLMWYAFNDKLMFLLTASAIVSLALGISQVAIWGNSKNGASTGWIESATIIGAILLTVTASASNDYQKNYKFQKLNQWQEERWIRAIRSGKSCMVSAFDIVVGDILTVEAGDILAADGILVEASRLQCDESHISGESETVPKEAADACHADGGDDPFMFSGASISEGVGAYVVTAVGTNSISARIAMSLRNEAQPTPLQQRLGQLAKYIIIFSSIIGVVYFVALFIRWIVDINVHSRKTSPKEKGEYFLDVFMLAVTVVIIGVPEGLSLAVSAALAFTTTRMLRDNSLVRLLRSCEVMGSVTTICSDKTGTLTRNEMSVVSGVVGYEEKFGPGDASLMPDEVSDIDSIDQASISTPAKLMGELARDVRSLLSQSIVLNSTAVEQEGRFVGSGTETALLKFAREHLAMGSVAEERANAQVVEMFPFNADRKYMAVVIRHRDRYRLLVKGAAEVVMDNCIEHLDNIKKHFNPHEELIEKEIAPEEREALTELTDDYGRRLLRPIAIAYRDLGSWPPIAALGAQEDRNSNSYANLDQVFRHQLTLAAILAIRDPLRPEAVRSIRQCQRAGIFVRMVTGDNLGTAKAAAIETGIYTSGGVAMDGSTFRRLTDEQVDAVAPRLQVLARSNADDKARLVMSLKRLGEIVAVTGDGTNDAFALKAADIGLSMGRSGTAVAKEASSIVLMDDNLASVVKAVGWGRSVVESVKKYCQFQFTLNITAAIVTIVSTLVGDVDASVFEVAQLLWLNLVMDILTGLLFSTDFPRPYLMRRRPEPRHAPLISTSMWKMIIGQSIYQLAIVFTLHYAGPSRFWPDASSEQAQTITFNSYMFIQLFNQVNCRRIDNRLDIFEGILDNPWFLGVQALSFLGQIIIIFKGGDAFKTEPLTGPQWGWSVLFGILVFPIGAAIRLIPDRYVASAGRALKPLLWPAFKVTWWARDRKAKKARKKEVGKERKRKARADIETQRQHEEVQQQAKVHLRWANRMLGRDQKQLKALPSENSGIALEAVGNSKTKSQSLMQAPMYDGVQEPLDLLAAVEASKYHIPDGAVSGLDVHPETAKDDPILVMPPTPAQVLLGQSTKADQEFPPSQNWEIMQHIGLDKRRPGRRS